MIFPKIINEINNFIEKKPAYLFYIATSSNPHNDLISHNVDLHDMRKYRIFNLDDNNLTFRIVRYFKENYLMQGKESDFEEIEGHNSLDLFQIDDHTIPKL